MTLGEFAFGPVFLSVFAFCIQLLNKSKPVANYRKLLISLPVTLLVCFLYPLTSVYLTQRYTLSDLFYFYCLVSFLFSIFLNTVIFLIINVKYKSS